MSHLIDNAGAVLCLLVGLGLLGASVHDLRLLRLALWGEKTKGYVEDAPIIRRDPYGDPTQWSVTTVFNVHEAGKRTIVRCTDIMYLPYTKGQEVSVHYRRKHPDRWATIRDPKSTLGRASGFGAFGVFLIVLSGLWILTKF
jgi:hypothetical protein